MGFVEKRSGDGGYRARYRDPLGRQRSRSFARKADAQRSQAIQGRMGHSSINVTLDRYGHLFPELDEAIASAFDARLVAGQSSRNGVVVHAGFGSS